jgi:hypothetical protein
MTIVPLQIEDLDLTVRAFNILKREGVCSVDALTAMTEMDLLSFRGFSQKDLDSVKEGLERHGLRLRPVQPDVIGPSRIDVEHVTVYRFGLLQVTVNGDGSGVISQHELAPVEMLGLIEIMGQIARAQSLARLAEPANEEENDGQH